MSSPERWTEQCVGRPCGEDYPPVLALFRLGHPLLALVEGCMGSDLEEVLEEYHRAVEAVVKGDSSPQERLWSGVTM